VKWLRQLLCRHDWKLYKFQPLVGDPALICTKCKKFK
jgi:hypothetical protein